MVSSSRPKRARPSYADLLAVQPLPGDEELAEQEERERRRRERLEAVTPPPSDSPTTASGQRQRTPRTQKRNEDSGDGRRKAGARNPDMMDDEDQASSSRRGVRVDVVGSDDDEGSGKEDWQGSEEEEGGKGRTNKRKRPLPAVNKGAGPAKNKGKRKATSDDDYDDDKGSSYSQEVVELSEESDESEGFVDPDEVEEGKSEDAAAEDDEIYSIASFGEGRGVDLGGGRKTHGDAARKPGTGVPIVRTLKEINPPSSLIEIPAFPRPRSPPPRPNTIVGLSTSGEEFLRREAFRAKPSFDPIHALPTYSPENPTILTSQPNWGVPSQTGYFGWKEGEQALNADDDVITLDDDGDNGLETPKPNSLSFRFYEIKVHTDYMGNEVCWQGWRDGGARPAGERTFWKDVPSKECILVGAETAAPHIPKLQVDEIVTSTSHLFPTHPDVNITALGAGAHSEQIALPVLTGVSKGTGVILNTGGPNWEVSWCPMNENESFVERRNGKIYFAVSPKLSLNDGQLTLGTRSPSDKKGCIQIWSITPEVTMQPGTKKRKGKEKQKPKLKPNPRGRPKKKVQVAGDDEVKVEEGDAGPSSRATPIDTFKDGYEDVDMDNDDDVEQEPETKMIVKCEMVLLTQGGGAWHLKWCPHETFDPIAEHESINSIPKLGVIAGTFDDGTCKVYTIPDPDALKVRKMIVGDSDDPIFVANYQPILTLDIDSGSLLGCDWGSPAMLACCTSTGYIVAWNLAAAINDRDHTPLPTHYVEAHKSPCRTLFFMRSPPVSAIGELQVHKIGEQYTIYSACMDGTTSLTTLNEMSSTTIARARLSISNIAISMQLGAVILPDADFGLYMSRINPYKLANTTKLSMTQGPVWGIAASDYHSMIAHGSADGDLISVQTLLGGRKRHAVLTFLNHHYTLDFVPETGEIRMLDNLLPDRLIVDGNSADATKAKKKKTTGEEEIAEDVPSAPTWNSYRTNSAAWAPEVGVLSAAWNNVCGIGRAGLLLSGTACGLARIDVMDGTKWINEPEDHVIDLLRGKLKINVLKPRPWAGRGKKEDDDGGDESD